MAMLSPLVLGDLMPQRMQLLEQLRAYKAINKEEAATKAQIIDFVERTPACFVRSNTEGHITGSCFLLDPAGDKVLLTHHKKIGKWLQLGGHADGDPDILRVALREAQEESGIEAIEPVTSGIFDIDIHPIAEHKGITAHLHYDIRFVLQAKRADYKISSESNDLAWIPLTLLSRFSAENDSLSRMAKKWQMHKEEKLLANVAP